MMETNRVPAAEANAVRLDAEYYKLAFRQAASAVRRFGTITNLEAVRAQSTPIRRGIDMPRFVDDAQAPRMVTIASFSDPGIDFAGLEGIDPSQHADFRASQLAAGDLVIAMGGYVGRAAICPPNPPVANIGRHSARVVVDPIKADPYFLWSFLTSAIGELQLKRQVTGSVQAGVNLEDLRVVELPSPTTEAQRFIGDKVRQAERLRERARRLEVTVATTHARYIVPPTGIDFARRTRRLSARSLTERLDAHFYPSAVEQYFRQLGGPTRLLGRVCSLVVNGQSQPEAEEGVPQATVTNLGRSFVEGSLRTVQRPADVSRALQAHDLLLCNAAHNKSYIGRDVTYSQVEGLYPSTEVMVLRVDRTQLPASFVRQYLKTDIGFLQIQSTIRGITAHTYPTDVKSLDIPIPAVPDADREAWFATDDHMLAAGRCCDAAKALTTAATMLVERLIDGRITEADLIAAQKALDAGDRNADREILKALRQSDAPGAQPLIADVDGLYALLDDSEGQDP
jgi:type I restriction enzyme S subunit